MMFNKNFRIGLICALVTMSIPLGCGRNFSPPPDQVRVDEISPNQGFFGTVVSINGSNFDPIASNNLVFFGNSSATVLDATSTELSVEVPQLDVDESVSITVSAPLGQGTCPADFHYMGPGHPLEEKVDHILSLQSGPSSISMFLPSSQIGSFIPALITNTASSSVSLMDIHSGWQISFGVHGQPNSGIILPFTAPQNPQDNALWPPACWFSVNKYLVFLTSIQEANNNTLNPSLVQYTLVLAVRDRTADEAICKQTWAEHGADSSDFSIALEKTPESLKLDVLATEINGVPFMPAQVRSVCLDLQSEASGEQVDWYCNDNLIVVTDIYRPAMAFFLYSKASGQYTMSPVGLVMLENKESYCALDQNGDRLGKILDLDQIPGTLDFNLIVQDRPEVWTVKLQKENDGYTLKDTSLSWPKASVIENYLALMEAAGWDLSGFSPYEMCRRGLTAITTSTNPDRSEKSLFISSDTSKKVFELSMRSLSPQIHSMIPTRSISIDSAVFSLQTATGKDSNGQPTEMLYAATETGLALIDIGQAPSSCVSDNACPQGSVCLAFKCKSPPMKISDFLSLPGSRGSSASIAKYGLSEDPEPDIIALTDTVRNQVIEMTAGTPFSQSRAFMVGNTMPQIAISQFGDFLYLTNPLDNSIQIINMNTGILKSKFSIYDGNTFGATGMMCIHDSGQDLLIVPLADQYMRPDMEKKTFSDLILRKSNSLGQLNSLEILGSPDEVDNSSMLDIQPHEFNEILVGQIKKVFFFIQYATDETGQGLAWPAMASASQYDGSILVDGQELEEMGDGIDPQARTFASTVKIARLDPDVQVLAFWEPFAEGLANDTGRISIYPVDDHNAPAVLEVLIPPPLSTLVADMAIMYRRGFVRIFLSLTDAGQVLVIRSSIDGSKQNQKYIQTSGAPEKMFFSPDGEQLFVTHQAEGRLSILETDCLPPPQCDDNSDCVSGRTCDMGFCVPASSCAPGDLCSEDDDCESNEAHCSKGVCTSDSGQSQLCPEGTMCDPQRGFCIPEFCETASSSLDLDASAINVVFSPGGDKAFITHQHSNRITVIE